MNIFSKKQSADVPRRRLNTESSISELHIQSSTFRRNRTITGSTSNQLNSVGGQDADLVSPRKHVHHLTNLRRKVFSILISVISAIFILWFLISHYTASAAVSFFDLTISKNIDNSKYEEVINDYLNANPLSRFHYALDQAALLSYMTSKLPEVSNVSQRGAVALGKTNYTITVREPVAGWKIGNKQFYVDSRGVAFETNYYIEPSLQIVDESGVASKTGMAVASNKLLSFVGRVVAQSNSKGYTVTEAILPSDTTRQLKIKLKDSNITVKLSIDRSAGEQVEDMDRAIKFIKTKGMYPSYIDVRVSGKAFYK